MAHFVTVRQQYLISKDHSTSAQASTILVTGVPRRYLNEHALAKLYSRLPGGVRKVWLNRSAPHPYPFLSSRNLVPSRDLKTMPTVYEDRLKACDKLESAETTLLKTAAKIQEEKDKKLGKDVDVPANAQTEENIDAGRNLTLADRLVPRDQRPTHRLPLGFLPFGLPLISKKVDSIDWAKEEIERTNKELTDMQRVLAKEVNSMTRSSRMFNMSLREMAKELDKQTYPPLNSAFILFNNQMAAHMAAQILTHHEPYRMGKKYIDVSPEDVVWDNLSMNPYEAQVRTLISYALTAGLVSSTACHPTLRDLTHLMVDHPLGVPSCIHRHFVQRPKVVLDLQLAWLALYSPSRRQGYHWWYPPPRFALHPHGPSPHYPPPLCTLRGHSQTYRHRTQLDVPLLYLPSHPLVLDRLSLLWDHCRTARPRR